MLMLLMLLGLVIVSSIIQQNYKLPSPITLMLVIMGGLLFDKQLFFVTENQFDNIVLLTLPLLIATDAMKLKFEDLKQHGLSLFWVAVINVILSVFFGVAVNDYILGSYNLTLPAIIILYCMLSATDPISVSAIFNNFKVPHRLKILTEGESLFNDATALVVFGLALIALNSPEKITLDFVVIKTVTVICGAIVCGALMGYITTFALKLSEDPLVEASIILFFAYTTYEISEHFVFSGILAVIVMVVIAQRVIQRILNTDNLSIEVAKETSNFNLFKFAITTDENQKSILKKFEFLSMFASGLLFISIAAVANIAEIILFQKEIVLVFLVTTIIRAVMMLKFAMVSNKVARMQTIKKHWWYVLTLAGSKGAISILMVHMLPNTFQYKILFKNIIIGNILLSTIVYTALMFVVFSFYKKEFNEEYNEDIKT